MQATVGQKRTSSPKMGRTPFDLAIALEDARAKGKNDCLAKAQNFELSSHVYD